MLTVATAADVPKLMPGNYTSLFELIKKFAGDAHASVAQNAIKSIAGLASGLRENFHDHALAAVPVMFAKFKEKRLTEDILKAMENVMGCIQLEEIIENLAGVKTEKAPVAKANIAEFINRAVRTTMIDDLEGLVPRLAPIAVGITDEKDATLRDKGLLILGVLLKRVPATTESFISSLIEAKKKKINEAKDTVQIEPKYDESAKKKAAAAKKAAVAAKAKPVAAAGNDDDAMMPRKKKAPAMNFGGDDEEMKDETLADAPPARPRGPPKRMAAKKGAAADDGDAAPAKSGPPARLAARGAPAASSGPAKVIKASDIEEEDIGGGMSKEQAIE